MSNPTFNTLVENTVYLRNKEFRISATENTGNGTYLVGIREYTRKEGGYTGYSKFNGVSLPAPTREVALQMVGMFTENLGNIVFPQEAPQPQGQQYNPQGGYQAQQQYAPPQQQYAPPQQQYAPQGQPQYAPQGQPQYAPQGQPQYAPQGQQPQYVPQGQQQGQPAPNPFLQNVAPTPYDNGEDDLPI